MQATTEVLNRAYLQGVQPQWLGRIIATGEVVEFLTEPWTAGDEVFLLIQKPGDPRTADCVLLSEVTALDIPSGKHLAKQQKN